MSKNWTREQYEDFLARSKARTAKFKRALANEPFPANLGEVENAPVDAGRIAVRVCSFRLRLLDPDNLYGGAKYFIDGLRHAKLIPDDRPQDITLQVVQVKVAKKADCKTIIKLIQL